ITAIRSTATSIRATGIPMANNQQLHVSHLQGIPATRYHIYRYQRYNYYNYKNHSYKYHSYEYHSYKYHSYRHHNYSPEVTVLDVYDSTFQFYITEKKNNFESRNTVNFDMQSTSDNRQQVANSSSILPD
ncbi:hypothetical protein Btru_026326, partial [Bulinus truncatus]